VTGRHYRGRTDHDHLAHATVHVLDDFTVAAADEDRSGGQMNPDDLAIPAAAAISVFAQASSAPVYTPPAAEPSEHLTSFSRGPPSFLS
jgi:hypothetical protein